MDALHDALATRGQSGNRRAAVDHGEADALIGASLAWLERGNMAEAIATLEQAAQLAPERAEIHTRLGLALIRQQRWDDALACFERVTVLEPGSAAGHNHLGIALLTLGRIDDAIACFRYAIGLDARNAEAHVNLGLIHASRGAWDDALGCFRCVLERQAIAPRALLELGKFRETQSELDEGIASCDRRALRSRPEAAELHQRLARTLAASNPAGALAYSEHASRIRPGVASTYLLPAASLLKLGLFAEAAACYRHMLQLEPEYFDAWNNLGTVLWLQELPEDAELHYRQALWVQPDDPSGLNNLGNALWQQGKPDEAAVCYRKSLALRPDSAEAQMNLGVVLSCLGELDEALARLREALRLCPGSAVACDNLGVALGRQGKFDEALAYYDEALRCEPGYAESHQNRAMAWLARGDFERGWPEYEWRWRCKGKQPYVFSQPLWNGESLDGRTILLYTEQGFGDSLQFVRYAALVKERGGTVLLACPPPIARLLARTPGIDRVLAPDADLPPFDVHAPLMSLPAILGTTLATIPANVPYLFAESEGIARWHRELSEFPGFKVGIAWQGNPRYRIDRQRSFPLARLAPLARVEGVRLFSLQKGAGTEQLEVLAGEFPVTELDRLGKEGLGDFLETAAIVKNLDLVVTPDMAYAHLAGGLGVRVWLASPAVAEWRWLIDREDSPWYPTMKIFRQKTPGDWDELFERMAAELAGERSATPAQ
jgi:tetratricopeptide (TPR) repeat protein